MRKGEKLFNKDRVDLTLGIVNCILGALTIILTVVDIVKMLLIR